MKKLNKKFLYKVFLFIAIVFCVDYASGIVFGKLYKTAKSGVAFQENYIMNKTSQELLIFGSSRAAYHYIPAILKDTLGISTYNCGREGTGIYYHYGVLLSTLERYTPKVIFLDIDYRDIYVGEGIFGVDALKEHAPFYHSVSPEFDSLLSLTGEKEVFKLNSNLYKYSSKSFKILTGNLIQGRDNKQGFRVLTGNWNKTIDSLDAEKLAVDEKKIETLQKFIDKAKTNNIKFVFTVSPYFKITPENLYKPLIELAKKNDIQVLNHLQDQRFLSDKSMFNDELHLNKQGAQLYSRMIASEAYSILNNTLIDR
ncbi:hypothetical protein [Brumimicrobium mesophilum]|uniref:hypothetical protein n=1 Tax=Brumimicrobium mesophilum TaxID=392717 RepID=UPI000D13EC02|nr:hypothetical protein [Brumimicrobium mesophilum]